MTTDVLPTVTRLMSNMQLQLEAEGYPAALVSVGLERARGTAAQKARPIRPTAYSDAFLDILIDELGGVREWMNRQAAFLQS